MASASSRGARIRSDAFAYMNLVPFIFFVMFPFYFMAVTSFKSNAELYNLKSVPFMVKAPIVDHYTFLFSRTDFFVWMKNSLLVAADQNFLGFLESVLQAKVHGREKPPRPRQGIFVQLPSPLPGIAEGGDISLR